MAKIYRLVFECCGNEVSLGTSPEKGKHDEYCISCDESYPDTRVITEEI